MQWNILPSMGHGMQTPFLANCNISDTTKWTWKQQIHSLLLGFSTLELLAFPELNKDLREDDIHWLRSALRV
jgi:hypothetical protein